MAPAAHQNFIDGAWRDGVSLNSNVNPSDTSDVLGLYAMASTADAEDAIAAAARGHYPKSFRALLPKGMFNLVMGKGSVVGEALVVVLAIGRDPNVGNT